MQTYNQASVRAVVHLFWELICQNLGAPNCDDVAVMFSVLLYLEGREGEGGKDGVRDEMDSDTMLIRMLAVYFGRF